MASDGRYLKRLRRAISPARRGKHAQIEELGARIADVQGKLAALPAIEKSVSDMSASLSALDFMGASLTELQRKVDALPELERKLGENAKTLGNLDFLVAVAPGHALRLMPELKKSKAQNRQDIFALAECGMKRDGFFVDFGATDGIDLSNSYLLETHFGWNGIVAEPAKIWHEALKRNRKCNIETNCVWSKSGSILTFNETDIAELSTINSYNAVDGHRETRKNGKYYEVETISITDLLEKYNAPKQIDVLSIDTEGSEFEILSSIEYETYQFKVIVCEHNYTPMRSNIFELLTSKGYKRKFENYSLWDDWYVRA